MGLASAGAGARAGASSGSGYFLRSGTDAVSAGIDIVQPDPIDARHRVFIRASVPATPSGKEIEPGVEFTGRFYSKDGSAGVREHATGRRGGQGGAAK